MSQSRKASLVEAAANVAVGYGLAVLVQLLVFPIFGMQPTLAQNLKIGLVFTLVSLLRGYALRRPFEALGKRQMAKAAGQGECGCAGASRSRRR